MKSIVDCEAMGIKNSISKKKSSIDVKSEKASEKLALFLKRFVVSKSCGVNTYHNYHQTFVMGEYTTDQDLIDELIEKNADIAIYERIK
jgi:hypothetical protein